MVKRAVDQLRELGKKAREWTETNPLALFLGLIILAIFIGIVVETIRRDNVGFSDKSFWDWLDLFIVSVVVALVLFWLRGREDKRDADRQQLETERQIERQRQETKRQLDNQHQNTLRDYFDKMSELILQGWLKEETEQDGELGDRSANSKPAIIARARTLAALRTLDPTRAAAVLRFLGEAQLAEVVSLVGGDLREVDWHGANLRGANLRGANLSRANLSRANLSRANLSRATLYRAKLSGANLSEADLHGANLAETNLTGAKLYKAKLSGANLSRANLSRANLNGANLRGAILDEADLSEASLRANLYEANLSEADLHEADLHGANLRGANLRGANLHDADLRKAKYSNETTWPEGFDPQAAEAELVELDF